MLYCATSASSLPTVDTETNHTGSSAYFQFIVNSSDTTTLSSLKVVLDGYDIAPYITASGFEVKGTDSEEWASAWSSNLYQCAVIHSRNTAGGLLVSTQTMISNKDQVITDALNESGTYYNAVLADWDAAAKAVLQGGGAAN